MKALTITWLVLGLILSACQAERDVPAVPAASILQQPAPAQDLPVLEYATPSAVPVATKPAVIPEAMPVESTVEISRLPTVIPTLGLAEWKTLPVIPELPPHVKEIYQRGLELGNNPRSFSKIGDCGSTPAWFLGDFDRGEKYYRLGDQTHLQGVIQEFQGSFSRISLAAKSGFNASSILSPFWSDAKQCLPNETPLACEYRINRPIAAFIMLGTNDVFHPDEFEPQMRKIIEYSIENGVIPILSTKADNLEGDDSLNAVIARLAREYQVPLLNYWLALQKLPDQGLQEDGAHITFGRNFFDNPEMMQQGWPVRNLTALQALDALWLAVSDQTDAQP